MLSCAKINVMPQRATQPSGRTYSHSRSWEKPRRIELRIPLSGNNPALEFCRVHNALPLFLGQGGLLACWSPT
jgi:hypothetical protein